MDTPTTRQEYQQVVQLGAYRSLTNKRVFLLIGKPDKLLKGITTNTLDAPMNAFINLFGKIEVLFAQKFTDNKCYLIFEQQYEQRLHLFLEKYLKLTKTTLEVSPLHTYHLVNASFQQSIEIVIPQRFGFFALAEQPPKGISEMSEEVYTALRVEHDYSVQGIDFDQELILNTNWKDVASLTKGCYLGQEVVARVNYLGKPPKKMARILQAEKNDNVSSRGVVIGNVTSLCYSPLYKGYCGFCLLKNEDVVLDHAKII